MTCATAMASTSWEVEWNHNEAREETQFVSRVGKRFSSETKKFKDQNRMEAALERREKLLKDKVKILSEKHEMSALRYAAKKQQWKKKQEELRFALNERLSKANNRRNTLIQERKLKAQEYILHFTEGRQIEHVKVLQRWWRFVLRQRVESRKTKIIQTWWRRVRIASKRCARIEEEGIEEALNTLLVPFDKHVEFEGIVTHLEQGLTVTLTRKILDAICLPPKSKRRHSNRQVRSVLTAFMINRHASLVLGTGYLHEQESKRLRKVSLGLERSLFLLQGSLKNKKNMNRKILLLRFSIKLYISTFSKWKKSDALKLAKELLQTYENIFRQRNQLGRAAEENPEDTGTQQFMEGWSNQLKDLEHKITKLIGKSEFQTQLNLIKMRSNETEAQALGEPEAEVSPLFEQNSAIPSNEETIYELLLNPAASLENNVPSDTAQTRPESDAATETYIQNLKDQNYSKFIEDLILIRGDLAKLTPNRPDLESTLNETLDDELILQQLQAGVFCKTSLYNIISFIGERIQVLEAPSRNEESQMLLLNLRDKYLDESLSWEDLAPLGIRYSKERIEFIRLDMANFQLRLLSQRISDGTGIKYVRDSFNALIQDGTIAVSQEEIPEKTQHFISMHKAGSSSAIECARKGFVAVICLEDFLSNVSSLPETLKRFDIPRLALLNSQIKKICSMVALDKVFSEWTGNGDDRTVTLHRRMSVLIEDKNTTKEDVEEEVVQRVRDVKSDMTFQQESKLRYDISLAQSFQSNEFRPLLGRISSALNYEFEGVEKGLQDPDHIKFEDTEYFVHSLEGLENWRVEVLSIFKEAQKLFKVNYQVYSPYYMKSFNLVDL